MNPSLILARFFDLQSLIRLTGSYWYTTTHQALPALLKRIYSSPSAWYPRLEFFKSIFWITLSSGYGRWKGFLQFPGSRTSVIATLERPMRVATVLVDARWVRVAAGRYFEGAICNRL